MLSHHIIHSKRAASNLRTLSLENSSGEKKLLSRRCSTNYVALFVKEIRWTHACLPYLFGLQQASDSVSDQRSCLGSFCDRHLSGVSLRKGSRYVVTSLAK